MNSSKDAKSTPPFSEQMPQILFPVRTFNGEENETAAFSYQNSNTSNVDNGAKKTKSLRWVGMNPLEMIETLAATTEQRESVQWGYSSPLAIDQVELSSKESVVFAPNDTAKLAATRIDTKVIKREVEESQKRRRLLDGFVSTQQVQPRFLGPWDLSFIRERDIDSSALTGRLLFLGRTLESMPTFRDVALSYGRVRDHFTSSYYGIQHRYSQVVYGHYATHQALEKKVELDKLFHETAHKLEEIIDMARKRASDKAVAEETAKRQIVNVPQLLPQRITAVETTKPKADLKEYMTNWLRDNWINPYPDEALLESMARDCGETPKIVNNWLINNRVRKWRKSIEEAMALKRPASFLLEDSINIFDKKKLRPLPPDAGMETSMPSPLVHKSHSGKGYH